MKTYEKACMKYRYFILLILFFICLSMIFVRISATVIVQADQPATIPPQVLDHHNPEPMMMTTELPSAPPLELEESDLDFRFLVFTVLIK